MSSLIATLLLVCVFGIRTAEAQQDAALSVVAPGYHQLTLRDTGRRYTLVIPEGYSADRPVPLVVSLHYGGEVSPFYGRGLLEALIEPALRELGAIFVAPDSAAGDWANPLAARHVVELLDDIEARYNIDADRTLLTGYSMGGRGTWSLAARHPDRFSAAVPIAGLPQPDSASIDWQTPLYVIHSAADQVLALQPNRDVVEQLRARSLAVDLVVVDDLGHYEIAQYRPYLAAALPWIRAVWNE